MSGSLGVCGSVSLGVCEAESLRVWEPGNIFTFFQISGIFLLIYIRNSIFFADLINIYRIAKKLFSDDGSIADQSLIEP